MSKEEKPFETVKRANEQLDKIKKINSAEKETKKMNEKERTPIDKNTSIEDLARHLGTLVKNGEISEESKKSALKIAQSLNEDAARAFIDGMIEKNDENTK